MSLLNQAQVYKDRRYSVLDLIEASKDLDVFEIKVSDVFLNYESPCDNYLQDFIKHVKQTNEANLDYPIILSPCNLILDGKHRLAKAIINDYEFIKAVRFKEMPDCGEYIED
jgi:hypothetical protein